MTDYTIKIIVNPERFNAEDIIDKKSIIRKIPISLIKIFTPLIPTYIFILSKIQPGEKSAHESLD